ncbi:MAG: hypothetical protein QNK27_07215 [Desulfuromusa sp.]|nr:hypothetical protein [Desulfuromusa sp.]
MQLDKNESFLIVFKVARRFLMIACALFAFLPSLACAQVEGGPGPVQIVQPANGSEVIGKKPLIKCNITAPFSKEYLFVYLDGADVTGIIDVSPGGFSFKPIQVLMSGQHQVNVILYTQDGREIQQAFAFSIRHSESFEDLISANQLTARFEGRLIKPDDAVNIPDWKVDANLANSSLVKKGNWGLSLDTNIRYFDQDQDVPIQTPLREGVNVSNYHLMLEKTGKGDSYFLAELGDVQITESTSTLQNFARRGAKASFSYKAVDVGAFVVKTDPVFGLRTSEDTGLDGSDENHLKGVSGSVVLVKDKALFKALYITGGSTGGGLGLYTIGGGDEGWIGGGVLQTDFFSQKFITEMEFYDSSFDDDIADAVAAQDDKAYRLAFSGTKDKYTYQGAYEYFGLHYNIPGQAINNDRQGFLLSGGRSSETQDVFLGLSRHRNNVDDDILLPTAYTTMGSFNYNWRKYPRFPIGVNYSKTILETTDEPVGVDPTKIESDIVAASFSYLKENLNLTLQPSYSILNNRLDDGDSTSSALSLTAAYSKSSLALSTGLSFNRTELDITGEESDNYLANLQIQGRIYNDLLGYGLVGSYNLAKVNSGAKTETFSTDFEIAYSITGHKTVDPFNLTIGIRSNYIKTKDHLFNTENENLVILLILTSTMPFTF